MRRTPLAFLASAVFAAAQSHPSWWTYTSPGATALIGIDWQAVRTSPFAEPVKDELWGDLGFPDVACLHRARQIVISSPDLLALATGTFPGAVLRDQAEAKGFKPMTYRGIDMWFAVEKGELSIARMSEQLVMLGEPRTLEMAVDRSLTDSRNYSSLLARAAKFAQKDLWIVTSQLPDDLANRFVPLDTEAQAFEGSLSVIGGLELEATLTLRSELEADTSADKLRKSLPGFPVIVRALQATVEDNSVMLALSATREEVIAALRAPEPVTNLPETIKVVSPDQVEQVPAYNSEQAVVEKTDRGTEKPVEKSVEKIVEKTIEKPQMIRIVGLDDGPREIVLKPAKQPLF